MTKKIQLLLGAVVALTLTACSGSGSGNDSENMPTYTESEFLTDTSNLKSTEKSLEGVGLRMKSSTDYGYSTTTTTASWDQDFNRNYLSSHPNTQPSDLIAPLENYKTVANSYLQKYSVNFNLRMSNGSVEGKTLTDSVKKELQVKIDLVQKTMAKLKNP